MSLDRYWVINHDADLTETGSPQRRTYLKTTWDGFPSQRACEVEIVRDWCRDRFGPEVVYVQGVAATRNWIVDMSYECDFEEARPIVWGGYKTKTKKVWLGIGDKGKIVVHSDLEV